METVSKLSGKNNPICLLIVILNALCLILFGICLSSSVNNNNIKNTKMIDKERIIYKNIERNDSNTEKKKSNNNKSILSFLDSGYIIDRIFNSKQNDNKFLKPYEDFMSFYVGKNKYPFNYIWFDFNYSNPQILYCSGINKAGIGNFLAQYWAARGIAFWLGYNFKMIENSKYDKCWKDGIDEMFEKYFNNDVNNKYWSYYLPKRMNTSIYEYCDIENIKLSNIDRDKIYIWITQTIINIDQQHGGQKKYLYKNIYRLFYYNPIYIDILRNDTKYALNMYFDGEKVKKPSFTSNQDIVIHFRCGDILIAGGTEYGFMTLSYYKKAFEIIKNKIFNITALNNNNNVTIWFLSQLGSNSLRADDKLGTNNKERKNGNLCRQIVYGYIEEIKNVFSTNLVVEGNNSLNTDFYRMVNAPILICSMSSFCEQAALININNVILPIWGPWNNLEEMIEYKNGKIWYPNNHHFIHNSLTKLTLTSDQLNKNKMNVPNIIQYLITH